MNQRGFIDAILRGVRTAVQYVVFFVLLHCRPLVKFVLRAYMAVGAAFVMLSLALKLDQPPAAYVANAAGVLLAALLSWKYDTLLLWLTPDKRRLILDI